MGNSIIIYDGKVLIDLTSDTVSPDKMLSGTFAHDKCGDPIEGSIANNGTLDEKFDGIDTKSVIIPAGYTEGGIVSLTDDIDNEALLQSELIDQLSNILDNKTGVIVNVSNKVCTGVFSATSESESGLEDSICYINEEQLPVTSKFDVNNNIELKLTSKSLLVLKESSSSYTISGGLTLVQDNSYNSVYYVDGDFTVTYSREVV